MYKILVLDSSEIDREMIFSTLSSGLQIPVELHSSINCEQAQTILKGNDIDLLIVDVAQSNTLTKQLVYTAFKLHNNIDIILTSVKSEDEIAKLASKYQVSSYLLKPFCGVKLLNMVQSMIEKNLITKAKKVNTDKNRYLDKIVVYIQECQYKKSIETAKEYINTLYHKNDMNYLRIQIVEFVSSLSKLANDQSNDCQQRLENCRERFCSRYDLQGNQFEATIIVEKMLDIIFSDLEQRQLYFEDDMKKVLNYIDRNIKKGITLDEAAEYINMSASYFSKYFKKSTGVNFITYVIDRKIEYAKDMLENTKMPVINIAYELSYSETNYFSKAFKKKVGLSPTEYREFCHKGKSKKDIKQKITYTT